VAIRLIERLAAQALGLPLIEISMDRRLFSRGAADGGLVGI